MKTIVNWFERNIQSIFFHRIKIIPIIGSILIVLLYSCASPYMVTQYPEGRYADAPAWAQNYDNENPVNYYYLPDIECYYDLRHREFVYMDNGSWRFSASLPSVYGSFDLDNCFVVKLNNDVVEPWMHFHYYVAHYPRYFYKSVERENYHNYGPSPRWFNENIKHYGYTNGRENNQYSERKENRQGSGYGHDQNKYNNSNNRENNQGGYRTEKRQGNGQHEERNQGNFSNQGNNSNGNHNEARQSHDIRQDHPQRSEGSVNREQPMKYYGKQIGEPVKVQRNMRKSQVNNGGEKRQGKKERKND